MFHSSTGWGGGGVNKAVLSVLREKADSSVFLLHEVLFQIPTDMIEKVEGAIFNHVSFEVRTCTSYSWKSMTRGSEQ